MNPTGTHDRDPCSLVLVSGWEMADAPRTEQRPETGTSASTYDAAGNLLTQTDAKSQTTTYSYEALNGVTQITFHDGAKQQYAYDLGTNGLGRLASITERDPANQVIGQTSYAYDAKGRVTAETRVIGGGSYVTGYSSGTAMGGARG